MEDDEADWRLKTLALEAVALQAQQQGQNFRLDLIDSLYPILHHLGSGVPRVRNHAITCLNIVSDSCGYSNVKELIVSNVDYLVNAVALKLNAFDVSPQGPQVLLMMVKLAGSSLLPYLEDTVESVFAALEDYHGYTTLVELLFAVLRTMAEEGVKAPQLSIEASGDGRPRGRDAWTPASVSDLVKLLQQKANVDHERAMEDNAEPHPQRPWKEGEKQKDADTLLMEALNEDPDQLPEESSSDAVTDQTPPPPSPKTYALLLKITQLTQHYLSSASPSLRTSLLSLLHTTVPALALHEDSYLPLINTLWPELVSRLADDEAHIIAGSLDVIAIMCEYAGSFMSSRTRDLWSELKAINRKISKTGHRHGQSRHEAHGKNTGALATRKGELVSFDTAYVDTSTKAVHQSLQALLLVIVKHVGVDAVMFDEALGMLRPISDLDKEALAVLEAENADAVWLAMFRESRFQISTPKSTAERHWGFAMTV